MSGPYSNDLAFLDDDHHFPYVFEDDFNQDIPIYSNNQYQCEQASYASQTYYQPQNHQAYPQAELPLAYDDLPPAKRLRSSRRIPSTIRATYLSPPRSTTPDFEPPYHARIFSPNSLQGSFSAILSSSLSLPDSVDPDERLRRQSEINHIFTTTKSTTLPPPSPFAKSPRLSYSTYSPTEIYRIRAPPQLIEVAPMLPKHSLGAFIRIDDVPAGAEREAAVAHNNNLAAARLKELKRRNNVAASRSRNRRERAVVGRTEELSNVKAQMNWWKARAVSLGARASEWDELPERAVRDVIVADYRVDAMDFSRDEPRELGVEKPGKTLVVKKKKPKKKE
ncbi:uncharacterized protein ColSpa_05938 [Colletotrichum spaethianum]|uniref:BZIP domain-containing protein n=1 Tax=Colletotrichum spaethianum TaxID=700344 RepID=A0AA37NY14_9PEZI|nr:uncharacterized protein ColSpa_05938 [Colletotrichum spaethianum]GKT45757.1 hypothetical protein ColSpa_05938 [Colletotrichum spaethianum]